MNKEQIKQLKTEFGIHFKDSPDEFGFLISFIDDLLEKQKQELREKIRKGIQRILIENMLGWKSTTKVSMKEWKKLAKDINQLLK